MRNTKYENRKVNRCLFFSNQNIEKNIIINNSNIILKYNILWNSNLNINLNIIWNNSDINLYLQTSCSNFDKTTIDINWKICWNKNKLNIIILNLIWNNWNISANWSILVEKHSYWNEAYLSQETIYLWEKWVCRLIPSLFIKNNEIKSGHSAKIHRFDIESINYMNSKGINQKECIKLLIEWKTNLFLNSKHSKYKSNIFTYLDI